MSLKKIHYYLFLFFVLFPYISFYNIGTDTQPYALIFSFIIAATIKLRLNVELLFLLILFVISIIVFFIDTSDLLNSMRSLANYTSLFFISYALFHTIPRKISINDFIYLFRISLYIWILAGLIQLTIDKYFFDFLISASRTTDNRGVTGLAPEPTFYGMTLIFYILIILLLDIRDKYWLITLSIFGILVLSRSSMATLYLMLLVIVHMATNKELKNIWSLISIILITMAGTYYVSINEDTRLYQILYSLINDPAAILASDASMGDRFSHIILSFGGFIDNYFLPNGYNASQAYFTTNSSDISILNVDWLSANGRIMSGYGAAFFELGFFAIIIPFTITKIAIMSNKKKFRSGLFNAVSINLIMLSAVQIAFTFFILYIVILMIIEKAHQKS